MRLFSINTAMPDLICHPVTRLKKWMPTFVGMAALALLLSSCASDSHPQRGYMKDGKVYGISENNFHYRWWNYYTRARSFINGGMFNDAEQDLQHAIDKRSHDGRRARTYGMHFSDYFPHRELGFVYFQQGKLDAAEQELNASIKDYPTAKANYYLKQVRSARLAKAGSDQMKPTIEIDGLDALRQTTNAIKLVVKGKVLDNEGTAHLSINGRNYRIEEAKPSVRFYKEVVLKSGKNSIALVAEDLAGNRTTSTFEVMVDRTAPELSIASVVRELLASGKQRVTIRGGVWDDQPIANLTIAGQAVTPDSEGEFVVTATVDAGAGALAFSTVDSLGNLASNSIELMPAQRIQTAAMQAHPVQLAFNGTGGGFVQLAKVDTGVQAPLIRLKDLQDGDVLMFSKLYLEGKVLDAVAVKRVTVNGIPVVSRAGQQVFFSALVPLVPGENLLTIVAESASGKISKQTLKLVRKETKVRAVMQRIGISLMPAVRKGETSVATDLAEENLLSELVAQHRFRLIERSQLNAILKEQKLASSALADPVTVARLGKIMAAQMMLMSTAIETPKGIEVVTRLVDTETAEVLATSDAYDENKSFDTIEQMMEGIALKLGEAFPLVGGKLIKIEDGKYFVDLGSQQRVRPGMRLLTYREGEPIIHPVTGRSLGSDVLVSGELRLTQVFDDFSICELVTGKRDVAMQKMDLVLTR